MEISKAQSIGGTPKAEPPKKETTLDKTVRTGTPRDRHNYKTAGYISTTGYIQLDSRRRRWTIAAKSRLDNLASILERFLIGALLPTVSHSRS